MYKNPLLTVAMSVRTQQKRGVVSAPFPRRKTVQRGVSPTPPQTYSAILPSLSQLIKNTLTSGLSHTLEEVHVEDSRKEDGGLKGIVVGTVCETGTNKVEKRRGR